MFAIGPPPFYSRFPQLSVYACGEGDYGERKSEKQKWRGHNEQRIVKSLPTKQSPSMQMSLQLPVDKDLFDGPHAEYEAANSLISILHG